MECCPEAALWFYSREQASAAARARAETDPMIAASHLARGVFLAYRTLDVERSAALVDATLLKLGIS